MNYKNKRWYDLRLRILKRDGYACQECKRYGKSKQATMVHHIFPAKDVPEYQYLSDNLISLCNSCHNELHERDTDTLTSKGQAMLQRHRERIEKSWQRRHQLTELVES